MTSRREVRSFFARVWLGCAALLLLTGHDASAAAPVAGTYRLSGGPDTASELTLSPDGTFRYFLSAGSLDEHSAGRWQVDGGRVRLTTEPKPIAPVFTRGSASRTAEAPLVLHVVAPNGQGIAAVDLRVGFDTGEAAEGYTQDYGWSLPATERRLPRWVQFSVPIHALQSQRFPIDAAQGNALTFVLTPNDLGLVDFDDTTIDVQSGRLLMHRGQALLDFEKM